MEFKKAERKQLKARISLVGASGDGKTRAALKLAYGLCPDWDKICLADTEYERALMHVGTDYDGFEIGQFLHGTINPPYTPDKFVEAIESAEKHLNGDGVLIIDTFTHEWEGEGGINDWHQELGGQFHHWKEPKKVHNRLIERIMHSPLHIIVTVRAKQEYVLEPNEKGKMEPRKVGLKPQQSNDYDYLFTTVFMMRGGGYATTVKDTTHLFHDFHDQLSVEHGQMLHDWLVKGKPVKSIQEQRVEAIQKVKELRLKNPEVDKVVTEFEAKRRARIEQWEHEKLMGLVEYLEKNYRLEEDSDQTVA